MDDLKNESSDWNQQQDYSIIFFKCSVTCREAQYMNNLEAWCQAVLSKLSHAMGILEKKDQSDLVYARTKLIRGLMNYLKTKNVNTGVNFSNLIFEIETQIDTLVNKKMPFLNLPKEVDMLGF